ncbi:mitochondrial peptide methionine sulfoxide reductase isoform X5 [Acinonyx jubatus]|uniref:peptide-methionine (S)-S-oxide reductase n=1 Tax=Acinonyx jubatus TaxID=32536 RepID=A0ABM3PLT7_ACIJB|nr:mitochondrial peptide methionine sulfoxide reductase isoform X5 [Acinonyx jubatus]
MPCPSFLRDLGEGREKEGSGLEVGFGGWEAVVQGFLKNRKEGMQNSAVPSVNGLVKGIRADGKKNLQSLTENHMSKHHVNGNRTVEPFPEGTQMAVFGMGCFWGAERKFWTIKGVYSTQVGYAGGYTSNPTYKEVCSGKTGHAEVVRVVYQPERISFEELLKVFWENHDPTQGSFRAWLWPDHDRHPGGTNFLLCGGLPPAVPEQEP